MRRKAPVTSAVGSQQESRNQILFRQVNERVREVVAPVLTAGEAAEFLCECGDEACIGAIRLDLEEYEAVRVSPYRFVVIPGHEDGIGEATVEAGGRYVVVERSAFREEAASHDPRRQNA
jgi:hypothetical protein